METLGWLILIFSLLLGAYVLLDCWKDPDSLRSSKMAYSIIIIFLPVFGAIPYFRHKDELEEFSSTTRRRGRNRRR